MSVCRIKEREAGRSYPRTCPTCKLSGACEKRLDFKSLKADVLALENVLENVVICYRMGWDMEGVIAVAEEVLRDMPDR